MRLNRRTTPCIVSRIKINFAATLPRSHVWATRITEKRDGGQPSLSKESKA